MAKSSPLKILVVEDEADIAELLLYNLGKEGYNAASISDGEAALSRIRAESFDLIILDLMLPGINGMELCRILRGDPLTSAIPIIMLTAKSEEIDRVLGLEMGADDYITKPFSVRELIARVKTVLRRTASRQEGAKVIRLGDLLIDEETYKVHKGKVPLDLSATEFKLLIFLAKRKGKIFSREQLLDSIWKDEGYVEPRTVDVHVRRLRAKIEDDPANPSYIKTRRGIGYYMEAES